jgi:hypothetical protein
MGWFTSAQGHFQQSRSVHVNRTVWLNLEGTADTCRWERRLYSLGVILSQLLTSELPFRGNTRMLPHQVLKDAWRWARCRPSVAALLAVNTAAAISLLLGEGSVARVVESVGDGPGESDALIELTEGQQPDVTRQLARRRLDDQWRAEEVHDLGPGTW